jgi:hypothetical protein
MRMKMPWDESKANLQTRKSSRSRFYPGLYTQGERLLQWNFSTPLEFEVDDSYLDEDNIPDVKDMCWFSHS